MESLYEHSVSYMNRIYLPTWILLSNFNYAVVTIMQDIARLGQSRQKEVKKYRFSAGPSNPALFTSRAKLIEQLLLLGVSTEYLLKGVLLNYGYTLNTEIATIQKKLEPTLLKRITDFNTKDPFNWTEHNLIYKEAEKKLPKVSGKTIKFEICKNLFMSEIVVDPAKYFSGLANKQYKPSNQDTQKFYGTTIDSSNVIEKIQHSRNNYAHIPDALFEEEPLISLLFNYIVFIAKKELPSSVTSPLQYT